MLKIPLKTTLKLDEWVLGRHLERRKQLRSLWCWNLSLKIPTDWSQNCLTFINELFVRISTCNYNLKSEKLYYWALVSSLFISIAAKGMLVCAKISQYLENWLKHNRNIISIECLFENAKHTYPITFIYYYSIFICTPVKINIVVSQSNGKTKG